MQQQQEMRIVVGVHIHLVLGHRGSQFGQRQRTYLALRAVVAKEAPVGEGLPSGRQGKGKEMEGAEYRLAVPPPEVSMVMHGLTIILQTPLSAKV